MNAQRLNKVLVVDDDPVVGKSFVRVLSSKGYAVVTACDGEEALRKIASEDYDAVFTDIKMPGIDGISVAEQIRAQRPWLPVVIVSGYATVENEARAKAAGVCAVLHKPLSPQMIEQGALDAMRERPALSLAAQPAAPAPVTVPQAHTRLPKRQRPSGQTPVRRCGWCRFSPWPIWCWRRLWAWCPWLRFRSGTLPSGWSPRRRSNSALGVTMLRCFLPCPSSGWPTSLRCHSSVCAPSPGSASRRCSQSLAGTELSPQRLHGGGRLPEVRPQRCQPVGPLRLATNAATRMLTPFGASGDLAGCHRLHPSRYRPRRRRAHARCTCASGPESWRATCRCRLRCASRSNRCA